jgi:hypothetical protein
LKQNIWWPGGDYFGDTSDSKLALLILEGLGSLKERTVWRGDESGG